MIWGWLIPGWLRRAVIGIGAALVAAFGIFMAGKREARRDAKADALKRKAKTTERVQNADQVSDADAARKQLKRMSERK